MLDGKILGFLTPPHKIGLVMISLISGAPCIDPLKFPKNRDPNRDPKTVPEHERHQATGKTKKIMKKCFAKHQRPRREREVRFSLNMIAYKIVDESQRIIENCVNSL